MKMEYSTKIEFTPDFLKTEFLVQELLEDYNFSNNNSSVYEGDKKLYFNPVKNSFIMEIKDKTPEEEFEIFSERKDKILASRAKYINYDLEDIRETNIAEFLANGPYDSQSKEVEVILDTLIDKLIDIYNGTAVRKYNSGEEIVISYMPQTNSFVLIEDEHRAKDYNENMFKDSNVKYNTEIITGVFKMDNGVFKFNQLDEEQIKIIESLKLDTRRIENQYVYDKKIELTALSDKHVLFHSTHLLTQEDSEYFILLINHLSKEDFESFKTEVLVKQSSNEEIIDIVALFLKNEDKINFDINEIKELVRTIEAKNKLSDFSF